ncbi:DNA primase/helicase [Salmonella phage 18-India]|nr:DNA primase/helicase [Salmonella phage 18-India]
MILVARRNSRLRFFDNREVNDIDLYFPSWDSTLLSSLAYPVTDRGCCTVW